MKAREKALAMGISPSQWTEKYHVNDEDHHTMYKVLKKIDCKMMYPWGIECDGGVDFFWVGFKLLMTATPVGYHMVFCLVWLI